MDSLKKWLSENPNAGSYDSKDLDDLWPGIEEALDDSQKFSQRKFPVWNITRWAAAILLVAVAGYTVYFSTIGTADESGISLHEVSPEMAETEYYYSSQVNQKLELIKTSGVQIDPLVFEDIQTLDSAYQDLMHDLRDGADNEEVVEAMIENYRLKLAILERILKEIDKKKSI